MLFNSYLFIYLFLPAAFIGFVLIGRWRSQKAVNIWLIIASLIFYAWWNPPYVILLILSIIFNYSIGIIINNEKNDLKYRKIVLYLGITLNILTLCYFKYAGFLVGIFDEVAGTQINLGKIILPLAISFFTLQQVSYLVDAYRGGAKDFDFISYAASVTFFPHLIAGPIVRYRDLVPQFSRTPARFFSSADIAVGLTLFFIGLFKKVVIADQVNAFANPVYQAAASGVPVSFLESWTACMAFTFQIYFDFSAYSDMAIGLGRIFGIRLPVNFNSPLKSINFIDFWRRWHITLSDFMRDYVYIPLGGSRKGLSRQYLNIMIIMFIMGLWHGAGWTYILWGVLHGLYIVVNHLWFRLRRSWGADFAHPTRLGTSVAVVLTFLGLVVSLAIFRADNLAAALVMLKGMAGVNGVAISEYHVHLWGLEFLKPGLAQLGIQVSKLPLLPGYALEWTVFCLAAVWLLPNSLEIMARFEPALGFAEPEATGAHSWLLWRPTAAWAGTCGFAAIVSLILMSKPSPFLYFQF